VAFRIGAAHRLTKKLAQFHGTRTRSESVDNALSLHFRKLNNSPSSKTGFSIHTSKRKWHHELLEQTGLPQILINRYINNSRFRVTIIIRTRPARPDISACMLKLIFLNLQVLSSNMGWETGFSVW